ncbi:MULTISPECIES: ABC transporter ATP-binding protein [Mesorhizobium]|uniref:ABC transporter ATP-binding protein n=4 Tax=Mesorhizobium TaxID=68287 RepID=A0ABZ0VL81_9HYPH|nr:MULTISPECIES: ABC transporter ATP-binding protein [Mesorhizobium]MBZ9909459.1 ABC transporter ATP-binding protein [Mesorhizobium sp. BR115XR7A]QGX80704.1 ABC transporter ATP-binding protein [Mesorhizobium japonicum R7A]QJF04852.1 ABC transporter ATP-binding protein [Mesorhizobium japonicum R7A]QJF10921.1 ABC transporter ATP-binding protein [Mesorhizobium japonicum]QJI86794.1 ABC transporter ATP-binding protein [Mesorhizobium japonicum]
MKQSELLRVENLRTYFYSQGRTVRAVEDVSFSVQQGSTVCLVGESGSGKSATAFSILNLIPKSMGRVVAGKVLYGGEDLLRISQRRQRTILGNEIAMIFQEPAAALNPVCTVGEQIAEVLRTHKQCSAREARRQAKAMLDRVGIPDAQRRLDDYPHQLSGGMRQRAMIAIALSCRPKLLIADEPTTALDATVQSQILGLLHELQADTGMALLFITHDLSVVAEIADRVLVMYAGRIVEEGDVMQIFDDPWMPYTRGLLKARPGLHSGDGSSRRLSAVPGDPPDLANLSIGCSFRPRCCHAAADCAYRPPDLETVRGHSVRCMHWRQIVEAAGEPEAVL